MKKARRASKLKAVSPKPRLRTLSKTTSKAKNVKPKTSSKPRSNGAARRIAPSITDRNTSIIVEPLSVLQPEIPSEQVINDLPFSYNQTKLVLMVRDPFWAYAYWDFSADSWNWIVVFRERDHGAKPKLRIHNIDRGTYEDRDVFLDAKNWYLELGLPNTSFMVELGLLDSQGRFHVIAKSNRIQTPRNGPSDKIDTGEWDLSEFEYAEIYRLSGGGKTGSSSGSDTFSSFRRR